MVSKERLRVKIQHVLDAVKAIQELEMKVGLCLAEDMGLTTHDLAGVRADAASGRRLLYRHLAELTTMLIKVEKAEQCFSVKDPKSEKERAMLKLVAEVLIGNGAGQRSKKREEELGILRRSSNWVLGRAGVCGREATAFCDLWLGIASVLLVVKLIENFSTVDMGQLAKEHSRAMNKK